MSEMVVKAVAAATAVVEKTCYVDPADGIIDGSWNPEEVVRAVIAALREPTQNMIFAADLEMRKGFLADQYEVWRAMIDAALK